MVIVTLVLVTFAIIILVINPFASNFKATIIGATWDVPKGVTLDIDFSDPGNLENNIKVAGCSLALGEHLIVAGQVNGPISKETYQAIIDRAKQIDPNYKGSIIRIGGKDMSETQKLINDYISKHVNKTGL